MVSRLLPILLVACGDNVVPALPDGAPLDAPVSPPPSDLVRIDWSTERGVDLAVTTTTVGNEEQPFAATAEGFATIADCDAETTCDYRFYAANGELVRTRPRLAPFTSTYVAPGGAQMLVVAPTARTTCESQVVIEGRLELVDLATGLAQHAETVRTNVYLAPAFTDSGAWWFHAPLGPTACDTLPGLRAAAAPFERALLGDRVAVAELPDGKLVAQDDRYGILDPRVANSFHAWSDRIEVVRVTGGWLHGFDGYGDSVERVYARAPDGAERITPVVDPRHYVLGPSFGRVALVCTQAPTVGSNHECEVLDLANERAPLIVHGAGVTVPSAQVAFLDDARAILLEQRDAAGNSSFDRVDLITGAKATILDTDAELHRIGDGRAAILVHAGRATLVEAAHVEVLADETDQVLPLPHGNRALIVRQPSYGEYTLTLLDLDTRTLRTLTRALYFTPFRQAPWAADNVGQPYTLRAAGAAFESPAQTPRALHFTEPTATGHRTYVMPLDATAPPRALPEFSVPIYARSPLASPDGARIVQAVETGIARQVRYHVSP